jgi:2,3-bisphosphoglycerate-dependent phosphoglycerate mutase
MTTVYFIRHAESDTSVSESRIRPLTAKGMADRRLVTEYLWDKNIDAVISSPFKRAVDTVADFAEKKGLAITEVEDFRERRSDSDMGRNNPGFPAFLKRQWEDFSYTHSDGESLVAVRERNIAALNGVLDRHQGQNIAIGTHGMALSAIVSHYDPAYGHHDWLAMEFKMPWAVRMVFDRRDCVGIEKVDLI